MNTTSEGLAYAITATMPKNASIVNIVNGGGHYPSTGIMEIWEGYGDGENLSDKPLQRHGVSS